MNRRNRSFPHRALLPAAVLILGLVILSTVLRYADQASRESIMTKAQLNAVTYANQMKDQLQQGVAITEGLEQILVSQNGQLQHFETIARKQMTNYIQSIQLAPKGVVTDIYPLEGNRSERGDLMTGGPRTRICEYGMEYDMVTFQGPYTLSTGGQGIAVRNPVFLEDEEGNQVFWGFTIAVIRVPEIFRDTIDSLTNYGYYYRLSVAILPIDPSYSLVDSSGVAFTDSASYTIALGNCSWKLEVMPIDGWQEPGRHNVILFTGLVIVLLVTALVSTLLFLDKGRRRFRNMAATDALTGLLNRSGFDRQLEDYFRQHPGEDCVVGLLDIDDFKLVNDVYGHATGDKVLKDLAQDLRTSFSENAIIGRNGGDEFSFLLKNTTTTKMKQKLDLFASQDRFYYHNGTMQGYSISLGYAGAPQDKVDASLLSKADMALYAVKLKGKHCAQAFREDLPTNRRTQLGFNLADITANAPTAFLICQADDCGKLYYSSHALHRLFGCADFRELTQLSGGSFLGLVVPEEQPTAAEEVRTFLNTAHPGMEFTQRLQCTKKDGSTFTLLRRSRVVENSNYGSLFYSEVLDVEQIRGEM